MLLIFEEVVFLIIAPVLFYLHLVLLFYIVFRTHYLLLNLVVFSTRIFPFIIFFPFYPFFTMSINQEVSMLLEEAQGGGLRGGPKVTRGHQ